MSINYTKVTAKWGRRGAIAGHFTRHININDLKKIILPLGVHLPRSMLRAIERTGLTTNHFGVARTSYATVAKMTDTSKYKFNHSMLR